jgi:hypothetical protein
MKVQRGARGVVRVELHAMELTALITAARWAADGAEGELPAAAVDQLRQVLTRYDAELRHADPAAADAGQPAR